MYTVVRKAAGLFMTLACAPLAYIVVCLNFHLTYVWPIDMNMACQAPPM